MQNTGNVFLYGTLLHVPLLEIVSGRAACELVLEPAQLAGHRVVWADGFGFPLIEASPELNAPGQVLRGVDAAMLERLNYYELGFGYDLVDVIVQTPSGDMPAQVYFPQTGLWQAGAPWSLQDWVREFWPVTRYSAAEVMGYLGRLTGAEVAARYPMILTRATSQLAAASTPAPKAQRSALTAAQVDLKRQDITHAGYFLAKTLHLRHPLFSGGMSAEVAREVFIAGDAAIVLPYDPRRDRLLLVEQFRMGPFARGDELPWVLEPVAGRIDGEETAADAALREAREEAHVSLVSLEKIASYYPTPGYSSEYFHSYLGLADLSDDLIGIGGLDSEHEDIRIHLISFAEAMDLVVSGEINIGPLILSLLWLERERPRLRAAVGI